MNPFAIDDLEQQNQIANATLNPGDVHDSLGFFQGTGAALVGGAAKVNARLKYDLFSTELNQTAEDQQLADQYKKQLRTIRPDPTTMGTGAEALFNIVDTVGTYVFGGAAKTDIPFLPAVPGLNAVMASEPYFNSQLEINRGQYDEKTAQQITANETGFAALGFAAPASMAGSLPVRMLSGAAINGALGAAERGMTSKILMDQGYKDMAAQYQAADGASVMTDLAIGALFGVLGEGPSKQQARAKERVKPSDLDAAMAVNNGGHIMNSAPGIPVDEATLNAHVASTEKALKDMMMGDAVDVSQTFKADNMIVDPNKTAHAESVQSVVAQHIDLGEIEKNFASSMERLPAEVPGAALGTESAIKVGRDYLPVRWALVDAADVEATMTKADNQFRDRQRASSQAQVSEIANAPDYNLLNAAPVMDFGAPTLTRQGLIVGGNGRFAGVSKAYDQGTHGTYSAPLKADLAKYGIDPAAAEGMKKPVLVRIMETDVDTRKAAIASNEGGGLGMSDLEQAKVDAERMGSLAGLNIDNEGNFNTNSNLDLIRNMVAQFPTNEKAAFVDADGRLSAAGVRRVRNAILYKAYGDSPTLARLVESTDPGARNVASALLRTASLVAEVKDAIAAGRLYPLDISTDIASAVETLDRLRTEKTQVADYLNQSEMFASELTIEARKILAFMDGAIRSVKSMSDMITTYYESVKNAGDPAQVDMLRSEPPTKADLLDAAITKTGKEIQPQIAELPFNREQSSGLINTLSPESRKTLDDLYTKAAAAKGEFDFRLGEIAHQAFGRYIEAPIKGIERAVEKITGDYAGDAARMKDILRSTIEVDTPAQAAAVIDQIKQNFNVLEKESKDSLTTDKPAANGYRDAKIIVDMNGVKAEVQIHVPEMLAAKSALHPQYERLSKIERDISRADRQPTPAEQAEIKQLNAEMAKAYSDAWDSATARWNSARDNGVPLRRADAGSNLRGGDTSQAAQYGKAGEAPIETGTPSTSKNSASLENFMGSPENNSATTDMFSAQSIVTEKPNLTIGDGEGGLVSAKEALAQADANIATAERESKAFDVAAQCALVE